MTHPAKVAAVTWDPSRSQPLWIMRWGSLNPPVVEGPHPCLSSTAGGLLQPDYPVLKKRDIRDLSTGDKQGTRNAVFAGHRQHLHGVHKTLREVSKNHKEKTDPVTRWDILKHVTICSKPHNGQRYKSAYGRVAASLPCCLEACGSFYYFKIVATLL